MKATLLVLCLCLIPAFAQAEIRDCGNSMSFKDGQMNCAEVNGADAVNGNWALVRSLDGKNWWKDLENAIVWGPTHAFKTSDGSTVAMDAERAEKVCLELKGGLPTYEDYFAAYTWQGAEQVMNNWEESVISPNPVFWATSTYLKGKFWWVSFGRDGRLDKHSHPIPLSGKGYPGDFRCIWRE